MLDISSLKRRIVLGNIEVDWSDTALVRCCRSQVEIKWVLWTVTLHQMLVDKTAWRGVWQVTIAILDKEPLRDSFVHNDDSNLRVGQCFVHVNSLYSIFKLGYFVLKHLVSLCITNTVSVDHNVRRPLVLVVLLESFDCSNDRLAHVDCNNLLALFLNKVLAVVLGHFFVDACREANNRVRTRVANINSNKHSSFLVKDLRELQIVQITSRLTVNLLQNVGSLR